MAPRHIGIVVHVEIEPCLGQRFERHPRVGRDDEARPALDGGRPKLMNLKELLEAFIRFRAEVITRRVRAFVDFVAASLQQRASAAT